MPYPRGGGGACSGTAGPESGQVFELADRVGRRPVGNIRKLPGGGYRLRFARHGVRRTVPEVYRTRADAERALWAMAETGSADCDYDRRYRALVLLATFASLRWGEATALKRCDLDLETGPGADTGGVLRPPLTGKQDHARAR